MPAKYPRSSAIAPVEKTSLDHRKNTLIKIMGKQTTPDFYFTKIKKFLVYYSSLLAPKPLFILDPQKIFDNSQKKITPDKLNKKIKKIIDQQEKKPSYKFNHLGVWLQITNECNLRCTYCYVNKQKEVMSFDTASETIKKIFAFSQKKKLKKITFKFSGGEPLLEFRQVIKINDLIREYARKTKIKTVSIVLTNGLLLNDTNVKILKKNNFRAMVSLDGLGSIHDLTRRRPNGLGSFDAVSFGISNLQKNNIPFNVCVTVTKHNVAHLPELTKYLLNKKINFIFNFYRDTPLAQEKLNPRNTDLIRSLKKTCRLIKKSPVTLQPLLSSLLDKVNLNHARFNVCGRCLNYLVIRADGQLVGCQMTLSEPLTCITDHNPARILNPRYHKPLSVKNKKHCQKCSWRYVCAGGCPLFMSDNKEQRPYYCPTYKKLIPEIIKTEAANLLEKRDIFLLADEKYKQGLHWLKRIKNADLNIPQQKKLLSKALIEIVTANTGAALKNQNSPINQYRLLLKALINNENFAHCLKEQEKPFYSTILQRLEEDQEFRQLLKKISLTRLQNGLQTPLDFREIFNRLTETSGPRYLLSIESPNKTISSILEHVKKNPSQNILNKISQGTFLTTGYARYQTTAAYYAKKWQDGVLVDLGGGNGLNGLYFNEKLHMDSYNLDILSQKDAYAIDDLYDFEKKIRLSGLPDNLRQKIDAHVKHIFNFDITSQPLIKNSIKTRTDQPCVVGLLNMLSHFDIEKKKQIIKNCLDFIQLESKNKPVYLWVAGGFGGFLGALFFDLILLFEKNILTKITLTTRNREEFIENTNWLKTNVEQQLFNCYHDFNQRLDVLHH